MNSITKSRLKSFGYAFNGLKEVSATQPNFKIHILSAIFVIAAGFYFRITVAEWVLVFIAIGMVTIAECFNTALEYLTNFVSPQHNAIAGKVKDLGAAGVLISAAIAFLTGLTIFIPKIISRF